MPMSLITGPRRYRVTMTIRLSMEAPHEQLATAMALNAVTLNAAAAVQSAPALSVHVEAETADVLAREQAAMREAATKLTKGGQA